MPARTLATLAGLALLLGAWSLAATAWPPHVLPGPLAVARTAWDLREGLATDAARSARRVLEGYVAAVAIGVPLGWAMGASRLLDEQVGTLLGLLRAIPPLAWVPLLLLWLGIGDASAALVVFAGAFFPVVRQAYAGAHAVPAPMILAAKNLGIGRVTLVTRVLAPGALPATFTGLRLGWTLAWMSVVAAELVGADGGLGQRILDARNLARPDVALAGMATIGALAALSEVSLAAAERRLLRWRP